MKFRKKPVVIEAWQFLDPYAMRPEWVETVGVVTFHPDFGALIEVLTLEGTMIGRRGDWIIKGVKGEVYPCKPDIFAATYEKVEDDPAEQAGSTNEPKGE